MNENDANEINTIIEKYKENIENLTAASLDIILDKLFKYGI